MPYTIKNDQRVSALPTNLYMNGKLNEIEKPGQTLDKAIKDKPKSESDPESDPETDPESDPESTDDASLDNQPTINFYGDFKLVLGGNMNDVIATSVQPDVAFKLIEAIADVFLMQDSKDAFYIDLEKLDPDVYADIMSEAFNPDEDSTAKNFGDV